VPTENTALRLLPAILLGLVAASACDQTSSADKPDAAAAKQAQEDAELEARLEKRKQDRLAAVEAEKREEEEIAAEIEKITVIPEGTKLPKKAADVCTQVVEAQRGFMGKFHPDIDEAALTTQLGMLAKQCNEMGNIEVAMCQKFALEATTERLKGKINEYLPVCMGKYGEG
jgi:hypothetical protein